MAPRPLVKTAYSGHYLTLPVIAVDTANGIKLAIGSSAVASTALSRGVYVFVNSVACYLAFGADPTATSGATNLPLLGASMLPLLVDEGEKVSVLRAGGTDGDLWIIPAKAA